MGLSRLENFLKNVRGNILYVSPNDLDATDSVENKGNSLTRPFKTIQRALVEASRFSYQQGLNNDRFGQTTVSLYPGEHVVDNRPGWIPDGSGNFRDRFGSTSSDFSPWDLSSTFELANVNNTLYKLNSVHGGVIVPRGTSIVGMDLRKTKIRPKYVPNPTNDTIERSAIFRVTGGCYFWQFSVFDGDPNGQVYLDYTNNAFDPDFSHHKLTVFEYADGVNPVKINDNYQTWGSNTRTDLDMYYEKVGLVYGVTSGRQIEPDYPSTGLDIQPKIDEYRIVGPTAGSVGISSIKAGDGTTSSTVVTVTTTSALTGADVDTAVTIAGLTATGYNGRYVITDKVNSTQFKYQVQSAPSNALPSTSGSTAALTIDTVASSSPYIFNCSLRSVYGMCGLLADGQKATGFKSMVLSQYTGIGLQKDNNAFVKYNSTTGAYDDGTVSGNDNLVTDSRAVFKPAYNNFHIKAINDATIQAASAFAIGYSEHFSTDTGGDMSITNSNSNFGSKALVSAGYKKNAYSQDDLGYITHIIPPKGFPFTEKTVEFTALDISTTVGVATTSERLYLKGQTNQSIKPENVVDGYRVGAAASDRLNVLIPISAGISSEFSSRIVMPNSQSSGEKSFDVLRTSTGINSVTSSTMTLTAPHTFETGETVRVISSNGRLPDGVESNKVYYAIAGLSTNVALKLAKTLTDAENASALTINALGGSLKIVSRVSDKNSGDIGHPIQYDTTASQWYIKVGIDTAGNKDAIWPYFIDQGTSTLGNASPRTYIKRKTDDRKAVDTTYRLRYVIPASTGTSVARPPTSGYIIQESNTSIGSTTAEVQTYFGSGSITNVNEQRNFSFIAGASWSSAPHPDAASIVTEQPHNLSVGSLVEIANVKSSNNTTGAGNSGYNGTFTVTGISSVTQFVVGVNTDGGTFTSDTLTRDTNLPYFKRKNYNNTFYIQDTDEVQQYISGKQDGIYYLTVLNSSNAPAVAPFTGDKFTQPVKYLYPQVNRDNPVLDPAATTTFAVSDPIGDVTVDDVRKSVTRETVDTFVRDTNVGIGITQIITGVGVTQTHMAPASSTTGIASQPVKIPVGSVDFPNSKTHTIYTNVDHGLNPVTQLTAVNTGVSAAQRGLNYGTGSGTEAVFYNAKLVNSEELKWHLGVGIGTTTGSGVTAKVTVSGIGSITELIIMNGGSAYGIGNTLYVVGIATQTGWVPAKYHVAKIYDNIGDTIRLAGVTSETYGQYNNLYRISDVHVGAARSFSVVGNSPVTGVTTAGIGSVVTSNAYVYSTGMPLGISTFTYDTTLGVATVGISSYYVNGQTLPIYGSHGLSVNAKVNVAISTAGIRTEGSTTGPSPKDYLTGDFIITKVNSFNEFELNIGAGKTTSTGTISIGSSMFIMRTGFACANGSPTVEDESINGRMTPINGSLNHIHTNLNSAMTKTTTEMNLTAGSQDEIGIHMGDYFMIDDEIVRIKTTPANPVTNPLYVFRSCLGTKAAAHTANSTVRRIRPLPVELRRHSINRVAGHTFEYVGFGPGNYSTALPEKQDRQISDTEELLGQSLRKNGGINYFSGMNDQGIFYSGNKKLNSATGKEEVFNTPIRTVTGEDISVKKGVNLVNATEGEFTSSINVTGGDEGKVISEFKGPVVFSNKVTSSSAKGLEASSLFLQGDTTVSRKYTVGISTPTDSATPGDITFSDNPQGGKYLGWVYTTDNAWKRFGSISTDSNYDYHTFDRIGIGTDNNSAYSSVYARDLVITNIDSTSGRGGLSIISGKVGGVGSIYFADTDSTLAGGIEYAHGGDTLRILTNGGEKIRISGFGSLGIGTAAPRCALDLAEGAVTGINTFMILPKVSSVVGLGTTAGAMMFNTATSKFQGFTGAAWVDLH